MHEVGLCDVVYLDQDFDYGIKPYLLRDFARVTSGDQVVDQFPDNDVEVLVSIVARHGCSMCLLTRQGRFITHFANS